MVETQSRRGRRVLHGQRAGKSGLGMGQAWGQSSFARRWRCGMRGLCEWDDGLAWDD